MKNEVLIGGTVILIVMSGIFLMTKSPLRQGEVIFEDKDSSENKKLNFDKAISSPSATESKPTNTVMGKQEKILGQFDQNKTYQAVLKTTEGNITIQLNAKQTPNTALNFVTLARKSFYNSTIFHRVIKGFMIQGGDPKGDGTGGPGYRFNDEPFEGEYTRGTVAMANSGPNTNGSQFFIMHQDNPLPKNYVIFGRVIDGIEVVDKIAEAPVETSAQGESSKPVQPVVVESVEIIEN